MANQGLIQQTTLEAAVEGVQVITKAFLRTVFEEGVQNGWFVDVTNDTFAFMRPDRDFKGFLFGNGGNDTWDMGLKRLGTELMSFRNYPDDDDQVDFRVRELQASRVPHANVIAWGATGDGTTDDRAAISDAITELKTAGGGEIFFPPGTYRMSTGISVSDLKGITFCGAGITSATIVLDDVASRHFTFTAAQGISFRCLTFQGAGSTTASNAGGGINMPLGANSFNEGHRFEDLQFLSMSETAIEAPFTRGLVISNVKIEDNNLDMIELEQPAGAVIDSLIMIDGQQRGLYIHNEGDAVAVSGAHADNMGVAFEVDNSHVSFDGCTVHEGVNRSASFPGYGWRCGHTDSLVMLSACIVKNAAGITAYVDQTGCQTAKVATSQVLAGITTTFTDLLQPSASVARGAVSGNQTIADVTTTAVTFDTVLHNQGSLFTGSAPFLFFTIPAAGVYAVHADAEWDSNITGQRTISFRKNGTDVFARIRDTGKGAGSGNELIQGLYSQHKFAAGDTVEMLVLQNSGGNLDIIRSAFSPIFSATRIAAG